MPRTPKPTQATSLSSGRTSFPAGLRCRPRRCWVDFRVEVASILRSRLSLAARTKILWIVYPCVYCLLRVTDIPFKGFCVLGLGGTWCQPAVGGSKQHSRNSEMSFGRVCAVCGPSYSGTADPQFLRFLSLSRMRDLSSKPHERDTGIRGCAKRIWSVSQAISCGTNAK